MESGNLEIRPADPGSDVATLLLGRYYQELAERFPDGFDLASSLGVPVQDLVVGGGVFLVAELGGEPIGCAALRKLDDVTGEIKRMWIDPHARGCGVARRLLATLEDAGRGLGCDVVRLDTSAHLTEAISLYRSCGYVDIPPYNDNPYAGYWFEKPLD